MDRTRLLLAATTVVSAIATAGSLFFSLGLGLVPCDLCWYQRILMYPLIIVLGVATLDGDEHVWRTGLPLSLFGMGIAAYHSYLQVNPTAGGTCSVGGGCTSILYPMAGGILTIPRLSFIGFTLVTLGLLALWRRPAMLRG